MGPSAISGRTLAVRSNCSSRACRVLRSWRAGEGCVQVSPRRDGALLGQIPFAKYNALCAKVITTQPSALLRPFLSAKFVTRCTDVIVAWQGRARRRPRRARQNRAESSSVTPIQELASVPRHGKDVRLLFRLRRRPRHTVETRRRGCTEQHAMADEASGEAKGSKGVIIDPLAERGRNL